MYESEANLVAISDDRIPPEILARFAESRRTVLKRTVIPWGEHCTECVWPTCYSTCDLYTPRFDGRCRRFVNGIARLDCPGSLNSYLLKISFKRWAKLWSEANMRLVPLTAADRLENSDRWVAKAIALLRVPALRATVSRKRYSWKKRKAMRPSNGPELPNCLLIECYNPNETVSTTLTIRANDSPLTFQAALLMEPGFNRHRLAVAEIARYIDPVSHFSIELVPNEVAEGCTLFFGALDFVIDTAFQPAENHAKTSASSAKARACKCVVWDLDNTLWDGVLVEDGPEKLRLKPGMVDILKGLDERGILTSAVSKNNHDDAMGVLERFGIGEYFLFPQISWGLKSVGVQEVARSLNIGIDSLLFVDDSAFEREQVKAVCPGITVLDACEYKSILNRADCNGPITQESKKRRFFYREQEVRNSAQSHFQGDYLSFLRDCQLRLTIRPLAEDNLERVHELAQRTNQMNFSGNRYTYEQLRALLGSGEVDTYVLDCRDRFGAYGTIGFCALRSLGPRMIDLMFSCRVQSKRVEHAFMSYILRRYRERGTGDFFVSYRKTDKNAAPGKVFADFGFEVVGEIDGIRDLVFRSKWQIPDDGIVAVEEET